MIRRVSLVLFLFAGRLDAFASPGDETNIVVIYADDLGYGDVSCYNAERGKIHTAHIDRLASQGMRFTDAHSSSAVCSPSRYTLLTGRYHWRTRLQRGVVGKWEAPLIEPDRLTIAGMLRAAGYRTACFGKWHLGWDWAIGPRERSYFGFAPRKAEASDAHRNAWKRVFAEPINGGPTTLGFDEYFGTDVPNGPPFCFIEGNRTVGIPSEFLPARLLRNNQASEQGPALPGWKLEPILPALAERASRFIRESAERSEPFFLYLPLTSPHTPLAVNEAWRGKSGLNPYADFVLETDAVVGRVLAALDASGVADRTVVVFTSDNGCAPYVGAAGLESEGHYPSGPLRGYKSDAWEGGHRVPFVVRWPGVVEAGAVSSSLTHQADLMATCAAIAGVELPATAAEDSFDLGPILRGGDAPTREYAVCQSSKGLLALRSGDWKLIFGPGSGGWSAGGDDLPAQLYHLGEDLAEAHNRYEERPEVVRELTARMADVVKRGRSTEGPAAKNDVPVNWKRFLRTPVAK